MKPNNENSNKISSSIDQLMEKLDRNYISCVRVGGNSYLMWNDLYRRDLRKYLENNPDEITKVFKHIPPNDAYEKRLLRILGYEDRQQKEKLKK